MAGAAAGDEGDFLSLVGGGGGMAVAGAQVDDFVVGVEGDAGVEEGGGLQRCEDEVLGVVDEVSVGHFFGIGSL